MIVPCKTSQRRRRAGAPFRYESVFRDAVGTYEAKAIERVDETEGIINGNCLQVLPRMASNSVDLIVTSPPYADSRKKTYGGIHPDRYVDWFLPISKELLRVLKPTGSFVLNIKEKGLNGERHTYVTELILRAYPKTRFGSETLDFEPRPSQIFAGILGEYVAKIWRRTQAESRCCSPEWGFRIGTYHA